MTGRERGWVRWLGAGLLLSAGCSDLNGESHGKSDRPTSDAELRASKTALLRADSCDDLLGKIQDDAIAKLDLSVAQAKDRIQAGHSGEGKGGDDSVAISDWPSSGSGGGFVGGGGVATSAPLPATPGSGPSNAGVVGTAGGVAGGTIGGSSVPPALGIPQDGNAAEETAGTSREPTGASDTNTQVKGVDEADFVKLVDSGKGMFLLHGSTLLKLKTYPAEQLSLEPAQLKIEGSPSEMFVTDDGRAVIFSSVYGYAFGGDLGNSGGGVDIAVPTCGPEFCGGGGYYGGGNATKITLVDVSGGTLTTLRELYYEGSYVSSRRIDHVVRAVLQGQSSHYGLFEPDVDVSDPWGRPYPEAEIEAQLTQWRDRVAASIRNTELSDWVPLAKEAKGGKLVDVQPDCDSFYVPQPGLSESGIVHVLSLDVSKADSQVGGVTVLGQANTVYSSLDRLVLAQPDYRWLEQGMGDVGFIDEQRTSLHVFGLDGASTEYLASGWVRGHLPSFNPQFGLDVTDDHTLRIATSGNVRKNPQLTPKDPNFWQTGTENRVSLLRQEGHELKLVGESDSLGHEGDTTYTARFVGARAYVVTFRRTDPLYVLDVSGDKPKTLGELQIPGFSQYMHPLDENHLITFGDAGNGGSQLQLFDVTDPAHLPLPKTLDFGGGSASEAANEHKAFTFYAPQDLIALPVTGSRVQNGIYSYLAALRVIRVKADTGFELLGSVDHSAFYATQQNTGCFSCGPWGCKNACGDYGGSSVRRGHFVEDSAATYVYAIGTAGVSVSDLANLAKPIAEVKLPAVPYSEGPWYTGAGTSGGGSTGTRPAGVASTPPGTSTPAPNGGSSGGDVGGSFGGTATVTPGMEAQPPKPTTLPGVDAGVAVSP